MGRNAFDSLKFNYYNTISYFNLALLTLENNNQQLANKVEDAYYKVYCHLFQPT